MTNLGNRRWMALGALTLAVLAVGLDATVLSVALPTLANALHASETDLQWFSSGYLLALAAAMLPAGLLGDRYGRKKVMLTALFLFGIGSVACAYAPSTVAFVAARVVLGIAGAGIIVMALSSLTVLFTEEERPRAVGIWAAANFLALPLGPILGGWLLTHYWWGWVFLINVPVALIGLIATLALVPESRAPERPGLDPIGIIASTSGLVIMTFGLIEAGQNGWSDARDSGFYDRRSGSVDRILSLGTLAQPAPRWSADAGSGTLPLGFLHLGRDSCSHGRARYDWRTLHDATILPGCVTNGCYGLRHTTLATHYRVSFRSNTR